MTIDNRYRFEWMSRSYVSNLSSFMMSWENKLTNLKIHKFIYVPLIFRMDVASVTISPMEALLWKPRASVTWRAANLFVATTVHYGPNPLDK